MTKTVEERERVVVRFAGDSGDGMQLTGDRFTSATAVLGNDLATLPDFPAEIRAPAGTVHGVSAFQIQFASSDITTPGDHADVLIAMNPAALKADLSKVEPGGIVIVNEDAFTQRNVEKAGYATDPTSDGTLDGYQVYRVPMTSITVRATEGVGIGKKEAERAKNMFALGLVSWMFGRPTETTLNWLERKFGGKQEIYESNVAAFKAGYNFGETTELFAHSYSIAAAPVMPGTYRNIAGSTALSWGLIAASHQSGLPLFYASYPITPASELLHELSRHKNFGVITLQAEDEIAAANVALGAAFAGHLAVTGTSGPGMDLKAETLGLAVIMELPMVIVDVQRGGPSTGLPTKTEQGDLLLAMFGRHGESPLPIVAASSPADCFAVALEASRIAVRYRTPVIVLSDTFLSNSSEPWRVPDVEDLTVIDPDFATPDGDGFLPYARDGRLARPWARPRHTRPRAPRGGAGARGSDGQHQLRPREPRAHDAPAPGEGRGHRGRHPAARRRRPFRRRRAARARVGLLTRHDPCSGHTGARCGREGGHGAPAPSQPVPVEHRRGRDGLSEGADPRDEPGAARDADQGEVPRRREELHQGAGTPDLRGGPRGGDPAGAR